MKLTKAVTALSALAQESRLSIFRLLVEQGINGLPAGAIAEALHIPSATLSFHLSQLSGADLITSHREGRMIIYSANIKKIKKLAAFLTENAPKKEKNASEEEESAPEQVLSDEN